MYKVIPIYLEKYRPNMQSGEFWSGWVDGDTVVIHKGLTGGRPRVINQTFESGYEAGCFLEKEIRNRFSSGYISAKSPADYRRIWVAHEPVPIDLNDLDVQTYTLYWDARQKPVSAKSIIEAYEFCSLVLKKFDGFDMPANIELINDSTGPRVRFSAAGERDLWFGFAPSGDYLDLAEPERNGLEQFKDGWQGWLTPNGYGRGRLSTNKGWIDFPVRLFMSKCCVYDSERSLNISCDLGLQYSNYFDTTGKLGDFAWYQSLAEISNVLTSVGYSPNANPACFGVVKTSHIEKELNFCW